MIPHFLISIKQIIGSPALLPAHGSGGARATIQNVSLPPSWADKMIAELEKDKEQEAKAEYAAKKQKILNEKVEISEKLSDFERKGNHWLEPNFAGTGIDF